VALSTELEEDAAHAASRAGSAPHDRARIFIENRNSLTQKESARRFTALSEDCSWHSA
jgi:hypothetical protein